MGNKQSGVVAAAQQPDHPTSRSFSWQPDPQFTVVGEPVKRRNSFTGSGVAPGLPPTFDAHLLHHQRPPNYAASEMGAGSPGVYRQRRSPSVVNGSIVCGDAAFGGVQHEFQASSKSRKNNLSPAAKGGRSSASDSGYMTEIPTAAMHDSDKSARAHLRGSRMSLNEVVLNGQEFIPPQPQMLHPAMMMGPPLPPGAFMQLPFPPPMGFGPPPQTDPFLFAAMMQQQQQQRNGPLDEKKAKKMRKKQQKQQLSRHGSMLGEMQPEFMQPCYSLVPAQMMGFGPMPNYRAQSIDNFMAAGLLPQTPAIMAPPPAAVQKGYQVRRYNSTVDLSGTGVALHSAAVMRQQHQQQHQSTFDNRKENAATAAGVKKERKYEKRKDQQPGSLRDSSLNSNRVRLTESSPVNGEKPTTVCAQENSISTLTIDDPEPKKITSENTNQSTENTKSSDQKMRKERAEVIYETLKGAQRAMLATAAEMASSENSKAIDKKPEEQKKMDVQSSPPPPPPFPAHAINARQVIITPEAKAILERNARILIEAERILEKETRLDQKHENETVSAQILERDISKIPTPPPPTPAPPAPPPPPPPPAPPLPQNQPQSILKINSKPLRKNSSALDLEETVEKLPSSKQLISKEEEKDKISDRKIDDLESMIEATLNPVLPRRKYKKPKEFEPLDAWRGINVQQELLKRQLHRNDNSNTRPSVTEERIQVRLVQAPPSKREQHSTEPIYLEYDERLPEFKKRLIETGSFDIPEADKFQQPHSSQPSFGSRGRDYLEAGSPFRDRDDPEATAEKLQQKQALWRDYVAMEEAAGANAFPQNVSNGRGSVRSRKTIDSNKGSLKRLKDSVANIFRTKSSEKIGVNDDAPSTISVSQNAQNGTSRYAPSLTPSTSKIKAGDSSDIDFSWVHDLETRFRMEREQFERELQTLKQKSATLQRNDYMLSPKSQQRLQHQNSVGREAENVHDSPRKPYALEPSSSASWRDTGYAEALTRAQTPPAGRMSAYRDSPTLENGAHDFSPTDPAKPRYFGVYDAPLALRRGGSYDRTFEDDRRSPVALDTNVRQKAALFESESQRIQREMVERDLQLAKQKQQRSASAPYRNPPQPTVISQQQPQQNFQRPPLNARASLDLVDEPIYIPRPDYDDNTPEPTSNRQDRNGRASSENYRQKALGRLADEPLNVSTEGFRHAPNPIRSPRSPSERRLARFYNTNHAASKNRYESQPVLSSGAQMSRAQNFDNGTPEMNGRNYGDHPYRTSGVNGNQWNGAYVADGNFGHNGHGQQFLSSQMVKMNGKNQRNGGGTRGVAFANE